ncbi:MAG TPA: trigger factor [Candidatus Parcubacteria bacterium]|jgi:trigger factor|nr:trigger factor [Candidatus Parcubacteria bacterium]
MKVAIQKLPKSIIELDIEVSAKDFEESRKRAVFNLAKDVNVKGFRKGKVPKEMVEKMVSQEKILQEAIEDCVQKHYFLAISENKIEALGKPEIEVQKPPVALDSPFEFKARVSILPEIKLPDYKEIASKVKRKEVKIEEKEIEDSLNWIRKSRAKFTLKNASCQKGDFIEIKFIEETTKEANEDAFILGEGHLLPGIQEKIVGMSAGEEREIETEFPQSHFRKDLAGKKTKVKVSLKSVQNVELPEANDQFAQNIGQFKNLEELKKNIKEGVQQEKETKESQRIRQEILEKISERLEIDVPEILVGHQKQQMMEDLKKRITKTLNISFEDYLMKIKKTEKELSDSFLLEAQKRVKASLVLREIVKTENIEVPDKELEEGTNKFLKQHSLSESTQKNLDLGQIKDYTREVISNEKALQLLEGLSK